MRFITQHGVVALAVAAVLSGCSEGEKQEQVFTDTDATRIANVRPVTPGREWPKNPEKQRVSSDSSSTESNSLLDPLSVEVERQLADLVEIGGAGNRWQDDDKLGNLT